MLIFSSGLQLQQHLQKIKGTIGFVPTMGALHEGHLKLISQAKASNDCVVCSIFVNPTQFNNAEDLAKYPRTTEQDIQALLTTACDVLFLPAVEDIYPNGTELKKPYELGFAATVLEGAFRPGHFQGVAQVVDRLLELVKPHQLFLGQKDLQQIAIIRAMAKIHHPQVEICAVPTVRAADGLAKSSRNQRLNAAERAIAPVIYQTLVSIQSKAGLASFAIIKKESIEFLESKGLKVEYLSLIDSNTWEELEEFDNQKEMAVLIAAFLGPVRLIDNILL